LHFKLIYNVHTIVYMEPATFLYYKRMLCAKACKVTHLKISSEIICCRVYWYQLFCCHIKEIYRSCASDFEDNGYSETKQKTDLLVTKSSVNDILYNIAISLQLSVHMIEKVNLNVGTLST